MLILVTGQLNFMSFQRNEMEWDFTLLKFPLVRDTLSERIAIQTRYLG